MADDEGQRLLTALVTEHFAQQGTATATIRQNRDHSARERSEGGQRRGEAEYHEATESETMQKEARRASRVSSRSNESARSAPTTDAHSRRPEEKRWRAECVRRLSLRVVVIEERVNGCDHALGLVDQEQVATALDDQQARIGDASR